MVRVPLQVLPGEREQVVQPPQLQAQRTIPVQDYAAEQAQRFGGAVEKLGVVAMRLGQDAQDEFDVAQTKTRENQLVQSMQRRLYDPRTGYLNQTGEAATGENRTKVFDELNAEADALERGLENETQRRLFRQAAADRMLRAQGLADAHEAREIKSQSIGAADTRQGLAINDALATYGDGTDNFARFSGLVRQEASDKADLLGLPQHTAEAQDPQRRALELDATTKLHAGVARKLLNEGKAAEAKGYLTGVSSEVAAGVLSDLNRDIDLKLKQDTNENIAQEIIAEADKGPVRARGARGEGDTSEQGFGGSEFQTGGGFGDEAAKPARPAELLSRANQLLNARKDLPEGSRDDIMRLVRSESAIRAAVIDENTIGVRNESQKWMRENPYAPLSRMPLWMQTGIVEYGLLDEVGAFSENKRTVTDPGAYATAMALAESGQLAGKTRLEIEAEFGGKLSPSKLAHVFAMHAHARGEANEAETQLVTEKDMVKNKAKALKIIPETGPWEDEDSIRFTKWEEAAQARIKMLGHKASPKELTQILDDLAIDIGTIDYTISSDVTLPYSVMTDEERLGTYVTLKDKTTVPYSEFAPVEQQVRQGMAWRSYLSSLPPEERDKLKRLRHTHKENLSAIMRELPSDERERLDLALERGAAAASRVAVAEEWAMTQRQLGKRR